MHTYMSRWVWGTMVELKYLDCFVRICFGKNSVSCFLVLQTGIHLKTEKINGHFIYLGVDSDLDLLQGNSSNSIIILLDERMQKHSFSTKLQCKVLYMVWRLNPYLHIVSQNS